MDKLNLDFHDPEEYEGKLIECNGCQYIIGSHVATGLERIVHRLINRKSGLCQHIVKIVRDPESERGAWYLNSPPEEQAKFYKFVLYSIRLSDYGGIMEIQQALQPHLPYYQDTYFQTDNLMEKADKLASASDLDAALSLYSEVLKINPHHTMALYNSGAIKTQKREYGEAFEFFHQALDIEPNFSSHYSAVIKCAAQCGYLLEAIRQFGKMKSIFPYQFPGESDLDKLGLDLCIEAGQIDEAINLFNKSYLMEDEYKRIYYEKIQEEIEALNKSLAILKDGFTLIPSDVKPAILSLETLENAYNTYSKNPIVAANFALALRKKDECDRALQILLSLINRVQGDLSKICLINAAFCAAQMFDYVQAATLFEMFADNYINNHTGKVHFADVNGLAVWIEILDGFTATIEEPKISFELIHNTISNYPNGKHPPETIMKLAELYKQAYEQLEDNFPKNND